jgi:hypothetical protein
MDEVEERSQQRVAQVRNQENISLNAPELEHSMQDINLV